MLRYFTPGVFIHDIPDGPGASRRDQPGDGGCACGVRGADHHWSGRRAVGRAGLWPQRDGHQSRTRRYSRRAAHRLRRRHLAGRQLHGHVGRGHGLRAVVLSDLLAAPLHPLRDRPVYLARRAVPVRPELRKSAADAHPPRPRRRCIAADADDRRTALSPSQHQTVRIGRLRTDRDFRPGTRHAAGRSVD